MTVFHLLRHAQTSWNQLRRIQGQRDIPLAPEGELQAETWKHALQETPFTGALCSDLQRAVRTAQILIEGRDIPLERDHRLREQDWGVWVGKTIDEIRGEEGFEVRRQEQAAWDFRPREGESRKEVLERTRNALFAAAQRHPHGEILVISHLGVIKCLLNDLLKHSFLPEDGDPVKKYGLHSIVCKDGSLHLRNLNQRLP
ncbi:histidine phosphatase family protein [Desulfobaculum bizertense]|uniref:Probable phosphoglycerate mutase n=1 Tax=Desulfobaculum bizertense DSM 18034 TaxID=1121442 RepID=A0A1T4WP74_9BACT|nr:histidine phosphatase family protein [Desulfobaculum bizertense]SKA79154.1 probable phosphoglycerate mutase [Desulfobaculum bizertense DSM 18034]